jgi:hypothetical protein
MTLEFSLLETTGNVEDMLFINTHLYQGGNPARYRDAVIQDWQTRYRETRGSASFDPFSAVSNWHYEETMDYTLLNDRGMVVKRDKYVYSGGAHGIYATRYSVFDLADHRVLKIDEFFREGTDERLAGIIIDELRSCNNQGAELQERPTLGEGAPLSQGIFFDDKPGFHDNFFICREGLGLNWAPYEIAPYSAGSIEIIIPWRMIRPLLRHDTMELLEKFRIDMFM